MLLANAGASTSLPRSLRIRFWSLRVARWLVPAGRCLILPLAERRNRFFVPLCVFCLGMAETQCVRIQHFTGFRETRIGGIGPWDRHSCLPIGPNSSRQECLPHVLLRRENHHNPPAVHLRRLFELGALFQFLLQALYELVAFVDVGIFAAAEDDAEDHLVLLGQELLGPVDLRHEIVVADLGAHAELFVFAVVRMAFVLPLLLLVLEFAVIHDAANGRLLLGRDFHEVEADFAGAGESVDGFENSEHFSFVSDHADG
jgi:hypothetical protein